MSTRKDPKVIQQILELRKQGYGNRKIAVCLGISKNTVKKILRTEEKIDLPLQVKSTPEPWHAKLPWDRIQEEQAKGASIKILYQEWSTDPEVTYNRFWHEFRRRFAVQPEVSMRLVHQPAEKTFFDFADGIDLVEPKSGKTTRTHLLLAVLPKSSYCYGEFILNQKQTTFMAAAERSFQFFGGVTQYVTIDNFRAGVSRAHIYDPVVNPGFVDFANYWGFAVLPARPFKPRDKAANESNIGVVQRTFYQEVRDKKFYSLDQLNRTFREFLGRLNSQLMKEHGVSRAQRFELEKPLLKPLALTPYEICDWKDAKVHSDCHIQIDHRFYSVPFQFVGRTVRVRLTARLIEVFPEEGTQSLAVHARLTGTDRVSTQEAHYPEHKVAIARFEIRHAKAEADKIGPNTRQLVDFLLTQDYPLKFLRRVQGILRLCHAGGVSKEALEYACKQGQVFGKFHYEYIKSTANYYQIHGNRPVMATPRREASEMHLHQNTHERTSDDCRSNQNPEL